MQSRREREREAGHSTSDDTDVDIADVQVRIVVLGDVRHTRLAGCTEPSATHRCTYTCVGSEKE